MEELKESGVEWIGKIPQQWTAKKSKYVISFINGYAFNSEDMQSTGKYPVIRIGDIKDGKLSLEECLYIDNNNGLEVYRVRKNDLLLAMSGATVGKVGISYKDTNAYINQRVGIIRSKVTSFIYYVLSTDNFLQYIDLESVGSAQPNISSVGVGNFLIPLPNEKEQQLIVSFLDDKVGKLNDILNDLNKQVEILEKYKKSLITETVTKGLNANVSMKDSGIDWIGSIPEHWNISKVKYNVVICNGKEIETEEGEVPVYGTGGAFKTTNKSLYKGESVLLGRKGTIDKPLLVDDEFWTVDTAFYTIMKDKILTKMFYYLAICFDYKYYQTGSAVPSMTQTDLGSIYIPLCTKSEQNEIINYLDKKCFQINEIIKDKQNQMDKIEKYKKSLIYEYVTGKKRVKGAEELYV